MGYNCDLFKIKEIKDFKFPVASLFKHERSDWHSDRINNDDGSVLFRIGDVKIHGDIEDKWLTISSIDCSGEGSGIAMDWVLEPAFEDSTGKLVVSCVWEQGDSINKLTVNNGKVSWENIDI